VFESNIHGEFFAKAQSIDITFNSLQKGCLSFFEDLIQKKHPPRELKNASISSTKIVAIHLWCTLFFLLNLRLTKQINKEILRLFDKNLDNPLNKSQCHSTLCHQKLILMAHSRNCLEDNCRYKVGDVILILKSIVHHESLKDMG